MPEESIQPKTDEQQSAAEENHGNQAGKQVVAPPQPLAESQKEVKYAAPADSASAKHDGTQCNRPTNWPPLWHLIVETFIGIAIAAFAAGQVIVGQWQWDATDKQCRVMLLDLRPWISIEPPTMKSFEAGAKMVCPIGHRNFGKTPGAIISYGVSPFYFQPGVEQAGIGMIAKERINDVEWLDINRILATMKRSTLSAGEETLVIPGTDEIFDSHVDAIPDGLAGDIQSRAVIPVFVVWITYTDSTGKPHDTWAPFIYFADDGQFVRSTRYNHMD